MSYKEQKAAFEKAEAECKRFLDAVAAWKVATADANFSYGSSCHRENAAVKRASMDLTRALVGVRQTPTY